MFNWEQSTYTLFIGIAAGAVLVLPFTGKIYDGRSKWNKRIKRRGWYIIIVFTLSVLLGVDKDKQAKKDQSLDKSRDSIQRRKTDSTNRKFTEESNAKIVRTFAISLAKYGLKYDSAENIIKRLIKDSSKKEIKIIQGVDPVLGIETIKLDSVKDGVYFINLHVACSFNAAYHIKIKIFTLLENYNDVLRIVKGPFSSALNADGQMLAETRSTIGMFIKPTSKLSYIHFLFKGTYENQKHSVIKFYDLESIDLKLNLFGNLIDSLHKQRVVSFYHQNGIQ